MTKILFVCTGNTCRSSMAEALFRDMLEKSDKNSKDIQVASAGIYAMEGQPASSQAVIVLEKEGIDLSDHRSSSLRREVLESTDLILTMTNSHKNSLLQRMPELRNKTYTLKEYAYDDNSGDIQDPFGQSVERYKATKIEIQEALKKVLEKLEA